MSGESDNTSAADESVKEARIRNSERHRIAHLLEKNGDTLVSYLSDPRDAPKLIAYLLRLEANRTAE